MTPAAPATGATTIRDLAASDLAALTVLEADLFPGHAWDEATWWAELGGRPRRDYVVAADAGGIAGYAGLDHGGAVADIMTIAVAPRARGRGLGSALLGELADRALARGAEALMLEVRADNEAALALYAARGFDVVSTRRGYYQPEGVDALVMRATLPVKEGR